MPDIFKYQGVDRDKRRKEQYRHHLTLDIDRLRRGEKTDGMNSKAGKRGRYYGADPHPYRLGLKLGNKARLNQEGKKEIPAGVYGNSQPQDYLADNGYGYGDLVVQIDRGDNQPAGGTANGARPYPGYLKPLH